MFRELGGWRCYSNSSNNGGDNSFARARPGPHSQLPNALSVARRGNARKRSERWSHASHDEFRMIAGGTAARASFTELGGLRNPGGIKSPMNLVHPPAGNLLVSVRVVHRTTTTDATT